VNIASLARRALLAAAALLALLAVGFGVGRALGSGKVLGDVRVLETRLGGLTEAEAGEALTALSDRLTATPRSFLIEGREFVVEPVRLGFALDAPTTVAQALAVGRTGNVLSDFGWWITHLIGSHPVDAAVTLDPGAVDAVLAEWELQAISDPPFDGGVTLDGTLPVAVYPRPGRRVERSTALAAMAATLAERGPNPATLPVVQVLPTVTAAEVDAALARARLWLSAPITLASGDVSIGFTVDQLAAAFRSETTGDGIALSFDPSAIATVLEAARDSLESPAVDARLETDGNLVRVVPGKNGTVIDPQATAAELERLAGASSRAGTLPLQEGAEPEVTTAELEALRIRHLVSQFTTYHDCCQNRVVNIHLIADAVDGAIVRPGATFSLNGHVGERTEAQGYLEDGTIIGGELVKTIGGGVSQFATTFYNAVFWGGYEDVAHKPHSFYFSRYPEGIEATISWPVPDLEFRNDSPAAVLVVTEYTDTSITVRFYGDNDGRIVVGERRRGDTNIQVLAEGGADARRVSAAVSDRSDPRDPPPPLVRAAEDPIEVEEQRQVQAAAPGWTVKVTRTIEQAGTTRTHEWTVRYSPRQEIIEVHPCKVPGTTIPCPEPTTLPGDSTTTTVAP
jgi:vancomycin resistance protein YoaR